MTSRTLPRTVVAALDSAKIFGIRAGARSDHRYTGAWPIVLEGRVFARSWTLKPGGWFQTFLEDPLGTIQVGDREVRIRAVRVKSERVLKAIEKAYAEKYPTRQFVVGFRTPRRRAATMEFVKR